MTMVMLMVKYSLEKHIDSRNITFGFTDEADTFAAFGEELFAGFFDDDVTTKKPIIAAPALVPVVPEAAPAIIPAKVPEVISNEVIPVAPLSVVPAEPVVVLTGEKVAEQVADLEIASTVPVKVELIPEALNEVVEVVEEGGLEPAASEIVVSEVPVGVTQAATIGASPVAAPVKQSSEEEEGLIEGIVNTLIDDGED